MKVLVTGGAGFIGSHAADAMLEAGHQVVIVDDLSTGSRANVNAAAAFYEMSICSKEFFDLFAQEQFDAVAHFAAQMNVTLSLQEPIFDATSNILGTINLLEGCVKHGVKRLVFASTSGAIYGEPERLPAPETTPAAPLSHYGASKYACEQYIRLYRRLYGLTYVILRFSNIFGPRQVAHGECGVCAILTELMLHGKQPTLYGFGEPTRDYVYVGDVARAVVLALRAGDNEIMNLASGKGTSVNEIFEALKVATGFTQTPLLKPLRTGEVMHIAATNDKIAGVLGWKPEVSLQEGLHRVVNHMRGA